MPKRVHIAITVDNLDASIAAYSARFGNPPTCVVKHTWALWRTLELNFSIEQRPGEGGQVKHIGFEDATVEQFNCETDLNGIQWEEFSQAQQKALIFELWENAEYLDTPE